MENNPQYSHNYYNHGNSSGKKTIQQTLEDHTLSLRKRKTNRQRQFGHPPELLTDISYKINISEIEPKICNNQLYTQYKNANNEKDSLGFLFQMLLSKADDVIKYGVAKIRDFLINIDKKLFKEKNYEEEFSDKLIKFLFELMFGKSNDLFLLNNICFILNKLPDFLDKKDNYMKIYLDSIGNILNLAKNISINEPIIKNNLYILTCKISLASDDIIKQLEKNYPYYINQIHSELNQLDENKFVKNMALISTLLQIINNCFYNEIYLNYFLSSSNDHPDELNAENIIKYIQKLLNFSYQEVIFEQEIRYIQNFLCIFLDNEKLLQDKNINNRVIKIIYDLEFEKKILPMIYDNTIDQPDLRFLAIQILINGINICPKKFCEILIQNNISEQIIKLENYLLSQNQFKNNTKILYNLLLYSKERKTIIEIFNRLISSNHKYIRTLLISEGICELYENILKNEPSNEEVETIIKNLITIINYSDKFLEENFNDKNNLNLILIHLEKIGFYEVINNLKSRNDLSDSSIAAINEISSLFNHN